ncbi:hypothetical protein HD554DRAFT_2204369 [Boletus coccyginus]|nr:hypothetical protein HD554DRAFT_2204369 [Boletus coccyginus]
MAKRRGSTKAKKPANARSQSLVEDVSEDYVSGSDNEDMESLHSDALDEAYDDAEKTKKHRRVPSKRAQNPKHKPATRSTDSKGAPEKRTPVRKKRKVAEDTAEDEHESDVELKDGQEVVGKVVEAPTTGWAPEGQISQHTLDFLTHMQDPACNDRGCFVEAFTAMLTVVDSQIPPLPPKDVIHRIYRDIRFSNDKTPYKTGFSASFSRSGRKGIFAFFCSPWSMTGLQVHALRTVKPGDESVLAAGAWCPAKNELNMIRDHIKHSSDRLREIISEPEFVAHFGEPRPHPKGKRQNIFGAEDELKTAPKGVDKNHEDIDLLKCRSLAVLRRFPDDQVLTGTFMQELEKVARILRPFVHCLNDMMTLPVQNDSSDDDAHE